MNRDVVATGIVLVSLVFAPLAHGKDIAAQAGHAYPWASGTSWAPQVDWLDNKLRECRNAEDRSEAVCGSIVAETLERVFGVSDFHKAAAYLDHGAIGIVLAQPGSGWQTLGTADDQAALDEAQDLANAGIPVLAVQAPRYGGHVTIILPGGATPSSSWQREVPNSASFFIAKSRRSFVGKRLSFAYDRESAAAVTLYGRTGEPSEVATTAYDTPAAASASEDAQANDEASGAQHGGLTFGKTDGKTDKVSEAEQKLFESALAAAQLAPAAGEPNDETAQPATQQAALPSDGFYGMWCDARADSNSTMINAVMIDRESARLSWGQADRTHDYAFEDRVSHAILEVEQEGAIVGISFSQSDGETADATAFFVIDSADQMFESHIFDEATSEIRARDTMLRRCLDSES